MNGKPRELATNPEVDPESGRQAFDSRAFRHCLGQYATGVTIVTTAREERPVGVTANSFTSVSLDPPLVLWSIDRQSRSFSAFESAEYCAINILASSQIGLAQRFSSRDDDKFAGIDWSPGLGGAPLLSGALAQLECRREAGYDGGDHLILINRVLQHTTSEAEALLFAQGRYGVAQDHPDLRGVEAPEEGSGLPADAPFLTLMFEAYQAIAGGFEEHRAAEGVTRSQARTLTGLSESPGLTLRELALTKYISERDAEDAVSWLLDHDMLARDPAGRLTLSRQGWVLINTINERWRRFEGQQLSGLPETDVAFARRFFRQLIRRAHAREQH
jgi:flavin reductase (DIM6/NTAB) family NADH-FMN oxidoreductase RutF